MIRTAGSAIDRTARTDLRRAIDRTARAHLRSVIDRTARAHLRSAVLGAIIVAAIVFAMATAMATALAGETVRVVVVATGAGDPVAARLIDELVTAGITVEVTADPNDPIAAIGRPGGARAVVRVEASHRAVKVWTSAGSLPETLASEQGGDLDTAARALALRVVEVLRPRLLPPEGSASPASSIPWPPIPLAPPSGVASAGPAPSSSSSASPSVIATGSAAPTSTAPPRLPPLVVDAGWPDGIAIYFGPAMVIQPATRLSPGAGALWGVTKMVHAHVGVDVCALVPVVPGVASAPVGQVRVAMGSIGAGVLVRYPAPPSAFTGWAGAGIGAGFMGYDAQVQVATAQAANGVVAHALPYVRAGIEWRPWPSFGLRAEMFGALARPRPVIQVVGQPDMPLEDPLLALSFGLIAWLP